MAERREPSTGGVSSAADTGYRAERRPANNPTASAGGRNIGTSVMLAILVVGLVAAGWFILNQKDMIDKQEGLLSEADTRLKVLEDRLRMTDETLSETGDQTKEKITFWESEIRKLWSVVNDRDKRLIDQNTASIGKLQKTAEAIESALRAQSVQVDRHEQGMVRQQDLLDQLAAMELQMQQLVASQQDLIAKLNSQREGLNAMKSDLSRRVTENEQAISAIDAYRSQISNRLNELERKIVSPPLN